MALSTAISIAAFSTVLTQSFVAVAASTMVPATFLSALRAIKQRATANDADPGAAAAPLDAIVAQEPGAKQIVDALKALGGGINDIDLLVPKTAKIKGEFTFEASERYAADVAGAAVVNVVAVAAAYSALYQTSSANKVSLEVDFAAVNYTI